VTDYQANYKWYPQEYYGTRGDKGRTSYFDPQSKAYHGGANEKESVRGRDRWATLLSSVNNLIGENYEKNLLKLVRQQIEARSLDAGVEFAYRHCQDVLKCTDPTTANHASHPRECVSRLPENVRNLCQEFVHAVDALKAGG
jgi:hypothetical protein